LDEKFPRPVKLATLHRAIRLHHKRLVHHPTPAERRVAAAIYNMGHKKEGAAVPALLLLP
jgi:hypothetical protein